jgi:hypothetical protein
MPDTFRSATHTTPSAPSRPFARAGSREPAARPTARTGRRRPPTRALALSALALAALIGGACAGRDVSSAYPAAPRVVAFGDVHGDLDATRRALRLAGAIDERDRWAGGALVVVQTGDQLDRGDDERAILELFDRLTDEAARAGGAFHALLGNHEVMNARLDLRYVTEGGFRDFEGHAGTIPEDDPLLDAYPPEQRARVHAFRPGGRYARLLARRNTIVRVGDDVFVHGGVLPHHVADGIDRINREIRSWLRGERDAPEWTSGADTPIWTRLYSLNVDDAACATLSETLGMLGARRMIVGHTVHRQGITSYCDDRVWAIDVGLAAYYGGPMQVLEIRGDAVRVLREDGG